MKFIGITGGVGAGKSALLAHLEKKPGTRVLVADEIAHDLMEPGTECYEHIRQAFGEEDIFLPEGGLDRAKLAEVIFSDPTKRERMNAIVHPAVREYILGTAQRERERGKLRLLVLEAALLIEEHYDEICDELWYIYTREELRRERLMRERGYSPEKVGAIFASQIDEDTYRSHCVRVIDNNGTVEDALRTVDQIWKSLMDEGDGTDE